MKSPTTPHIEASGFRKYFIIPLILSGELRTGSKCIFRSLILFSLVQTLKSMFISIHLQSYSARKHVSGLALFRRPMNYRSPGAGILKIKCTVVQELGLQYDGNFTSIRFGRIGGANKPVMCFPFVGFPGTPAVRNSVRKSEGPEPSSPLVAILADMLKSALDWETSKECASSDGDLAGVPWVGATGRQRSKKKRKLGEGRIWLRRDAAARS